MTSEEIEIKFSISVKAINAHTEPFPADTLLKLYAYYKRATASSDTSSGGKPLIHAFKTNALFQTRHLTSDEAKELYIETANYYFLYRK